MIHPNGNFFKFVLAINKEEFEKSRHFNILTESGGSFGSQKKRKTSRDINTKIIDAIYDLEKGKITIDSYLRRLVFPNNYTCTETKPVDDILQESSADDSEDESSEDGEEINEHQNDSTLLCIICHDAAPNILVLPCRHIKICSACYMILQARALANNDPSTKCPYCRQSISDSMQVFL